MVSIAGPVLRRRPLPTIDIGVPLGGGLIAAVPTGRAPRLSRVTIQYAVVLFYIGAAGRIVSTSAPLGGDHHGARAMAAFLQRPKLATIADR